MFENSDEDDGYYADFESEIMMQKSRVKTIKTRAVRLGTEQEGEESEDSVIIEEQPALKELRELEELQDEDDPDLDTEEDQHNGREGSCRNFDNAYKEDDKAKVPER